MNPDDLEQVMDRELKRLPTPRAPATLLPRVLAATVQGTPAPWYARPWLTWPRAWQAVSIAVLMAVGVGLAIGWAALPQAPVPAVSRAAGAAGGRIGAVVAALAGAATLARVLWQVVVEPVGLTLLIFAVSLSLACAAIWTALDRLAVGACSSNARHAPGS